MSFAFGGWEAAVYTWALLALRVLPFVVLVPAFAGSKLVPSVRGAVVAVLTLALWPAELVPMPGALDAAAALASQLVAGLCAGAAIGAAAEGARALGALSDVTLGRGSMGAGDPLAGGPSGPLSSLYAWMWLVLFVGSGAHLLLLEAFALGFDALPLGASFADGQLAAMVTRVLDTVAAAFALTVAFALPAFTISWVIDLALGWLGRAMPQLPAMFLAMPLRGVLGAFVVAASLGTLTLAFVDLALQAAAP